MKRLALIVGLVLLKVSPIWAQLPTSDLQQVEILPLSGAHVPIDVLWMAENGASITIRQALAERPTLLMFADYTCTTLCGLVLTFVVDALVKSGLSPQDYQLGVLGHHATATGFDNDAIGKDTLTLESRP